MVETRSGRKPPSLKKTKQGRVSKTLSTPRRGRRPTAKQVENAINGKKANAATPVQMNNLIMEVASNNTQLANRLKNAVRPNKPVRPNAPVAPNLNALRINIAKRLAVEPNRNVRMAVLKRVNKKISELRKIINKAESGNTWLRQRTASAKYAKNNVSSFRIGKKRCMYYKKQQLMNFANTTNDSLTKVELCKIIKEKNAAPNAPVVTPKIANKNRTCNTMKLNELKRIAGANSNKIEGRMTKRKLCEIINAKNNALNNRGGKKSKKNSVPKFRSTVNNLN